MWIYTIFGYIYFILFEHVNNLVTYLFLEESTNNQNLSVCDLITVNLASDLFVTDHL